MRQCNDVLKPLLLHHLDSLLSRLLRILKGYVFPRAGGFSSILCRHSEYPDLHSVYIQDHIGIYTRICSRFLCGRIDRNRTFHQ
ncbi:hypothetical protein D3C74_289420 [compost metagenome]